MPDSEKETGKRVVGVVEQQECSIPWSVLSLVCVVVL
jgi:hypothetical protein